MGDWWQRDIVEPGKLPLLLAFAALVVTFVATRIVTRMIRAGVGPFRDRVSPSGLHIHHSVPGIIILVVGAFLALSAHALSPVEYLAAVLVGVGTSLTLDEFALILHLEDVYWAAEGRASFEVVSLAVGCLGLALVGLSPLGVNEVDNAELAVRVVAIVGVMAALVLVLICVGKGKLTLALLGVFAPVLALVGATRLARPGSWWARHRYGPGRQQRAAERAARLDARWDPAFYRLSDLIAGKPSGPPTGVPGPDELTEVGSSHEQHDRTGET